MRPFKRCGTNDSQKARFAALVERLVKFLALLIGHDVGRALDDIGDHAHAIGMFGQHVKIKGPRQFHRLASVRCHLLTPRNAVHVTRQQSRATAACIRRQGRVHMGVAKQQLGQKIPVGIRCAWPYGAACAGGFYPRPTICQFGLCKDQA